MEVPETRKHIDTIVVDRDDLSESDAVFVSTFGRRIGLGLAAGGDVEVWLTREECQSILVALEAAAIRVKRPGEEVFSEIYLQQSNDFGMMVPGFALVSNHGIEVGLYIAVKGSGGGQVWMSLSHCERIMAALQAASECM